MTVAHIVITVEEYGVSPEEYALRLSYSGVNDLQTEQTQAVFYNVLKEIVGVLDKKQEE